MNHSIDASHLLNKKGLNESLHSFTWGLDWMSQTNSNVPVC